jgi:hypothetical protein
MPAAAQGSGRTLYLGSAAALALGVLGSWPASAQEAPEQDLVPVGCTVSVGFAKGEKGEVDQRFRGLPSQFGSVQLVDEQAMKLQFGEVGRMPLPTGSELSVQPVSVRGSRLKMNLNLPGVVDAKLRMQNHRPLMLGPLPHGDGYLVIRVEPEFTDHLATEPQSGPQPIQVNRQEP